MIMESVGIFLISEVLVLNYYSVLIFLLIALSKDGLNDRIYIYHLVESGDNLSAKMTVHV